MTHQFLQCDLLNLLLIELATDNQCSPMIILPAAVCMVTSHTMTYNSPIWLLCHTEEECLP